uniref:Uncharacterized protein n=1 Tax=Arundo donax TaxID=35708 RepID=A0A0A9HB21_ARUDO
MLFISNVVCKDVAQ